MESIGEPTELIEYAFDDDEVGAANWLDQFDTEPRLCFGIRDWDAKQAPYNQRSASQFFPALRNQLLKLSIPFKVA